MSYLRLYDYLKVIQAENLLQLINSDSGIRFTSEVEAQAEAISYLTQKYDVDSEFSDTNPFSITATYSADSLVELYYPDYIAANTYNTNELTIFSGSAYICTGTTTGTFDPTKWTLLGVKYDLFFIALPADAFDYRRFYNKGDVVFYKNKTYTASRSSSIIDSETALQYGSTYNVPYPNVFPDDPLLGSTYWGIGVLYSVNGVLPTDTTKWTKGDNRSAQLVQKVVDICLYHIHSRIAPRNIPALRENRYAAAIAWLDAAKEGEVTADIPLRQPKRGGRIRWGSDVKNNDNDI